MVDADIYIGRHALQAKVPRRLIAEVESRGRRSLRQPIASVIYGESGDVNVGNTELDLSFSYQTLDPETVESEVLFTDHGLVVEDYKELTGFVMVDKNGNRLSFKELLPQGERVIFNPQDSIREGAFYVPTPHRLVVIEGDGGMVKPGAIIRALHEIGHAVKGDGQDQLEVRDAFYKNTRPVDNTDLAKIMESERDAWAFVFRTLRPFIKTGEENSGSVFFRNRLMLYAGVRLAGYADDIKRKIMDQAQSAS